MTTPTTQEEKKALSPAGLLDNLRALHVDLTAQHAHAGAQADWWREWISPHYGQLKAVEWDSKGEEIAEKAAALEQTIAGLGRLQALEEALKPFAAVGALVNALMEDYPVYGVNETTISHADLRRAAALLEQKGVDPR